MLVSIIFEQVVFKTWDYLYLAKIKDTAMIRPNIVILRSDSTFYTLILILTVTFGWL